MQLPANVLAIRDRYVAAFPVPQGTPGEAFEEQARQWSIRFAEHVAYELGSEWGMKRADPNRPISKDTLSFNLGNGRIRIWDLLKGTGTGNPKLVLQPESDDIEDQVFVPVTPTNHLGVPDSGIPNQPSLPPLPPADLGPVMSKLAAIFDTMVRQGDSLDTLEARLNQANAAWNALQPTLQAVVVELQTIRGLLEAERHPTYSVRVYGRTIGEATPK